MEYDPYPKSIAELTAWRRENRVTTEEARRRLVQFVVLASIASSASLASRLALKGGNALRFAHGNRRSTLDLDFTADGEFPDDDVTIASLLNLALAKAERQFQIKARCQSIHRNPKNPSRTLPTYQINMCYQIIGDKYYRNFEEPRALPFVELEISLNDVLCETIPKLLGDTTQPLRVCSLEDILAEKLRALLQQVIRNRSRPQDVYDIASRVREMGGLIDAEKISDFLVRKCVARDISPRKSSYDEAVRRQASFGYNSEIKEQTTEFIPFSEAWLEVLGQVDRLSIPD